MRRSRLSFLVGSVHDTLPSQVNLARWRRVEDPACRLCGDRRESLDHVLAGCSIALGDGRYRFRHDRVLSSLRDGILEQVERVKSLPASKPAAISFVCAGARPQVPKSGMNSRSLLAGPTDWSVRVDLEQSLAFPSHIAETRLRPDIVLWSDSDRRLVIGELTVPLEANVLEAHERKTKKYENLVLECEASGWRVHFFAIEVGCRGFPTPSLSRFLGCLGAAGKNRSRTVEKVCDRAESASFWIWCKRADVWDPSPLRPVAPQ